MRVCFRVLLQRVGLIGDRFLNVFREKFYIRILIQKFGNDFFLFVCSCKILALPNLPSSLSLSSSSNIDEEWCSNDELSDEYEIDESSVDDEHPSSTSGPRVKKHVNKGRWTKDEDEVRDTRPREESLLSLSEGDFVYCFLGC